MTPHEKVAYIADNPDIVTPSGWMPLAAMPLTRRIEFLLSDGRTYIGCASNAAFLISKENHVAWRPV